MQLKNLGLRSQCVIGSILSAEGSLLWVFTVFPRYGVISYVVFLVTEVFLGFRSEFPLRRFDVGLWL